MEQDVLIRRERLGGEKMSDVEARDALREQISALADGDTVQQQEALLARLGRDPQARAIWLEYHQIGDLVRSPALLPLPDEDGFARKVAERIRREPLPARAQPRATARGGWRWGLAGMVAAGVVAAGVIATEVPPARRAPQYAVAAGRPTTCATSGGETGRDAWRDYVASRHLDAGYLASDPLSQARPTQYAALH